MLLIVLLCFLTIGSQIEAKNYLLKSSKNSETLLRNERDFEDFQTQILSYLDIFSAGCDPTFCDNISNPDNPNNCSAFCEPNNTKFENVLTTAQKCLKVIQCERSLNVWQLNQINVTLGVQGFNGQCILFGLQPSVSGAANGTFNSELISPDVIAYQTSNAFQLTYDGFSVYCKSCPQSLAVNQSSNSLLATALSQLNQLINIILCSLSTALGLKLECDRGGEGSVAWGAEEFTSTATVTQKYSGDFFFGLSSNGVGLPGLYTVNTEVQLGSGVPPELQTSVKNALTNELENAQLTSAISQSYINFVNAIIETVQYRNCFGESRCSD